MCNGKSENNSRDNVFVKDDKWLLGDFEFFVVISGKVLVSFVVRWIVWE